MDWFSPMPTQEENAPPQPLWENLLASPCNPPLWFKRPPSTPMSEFASPDESVFPLTAPSIESRTPIILLLHWLIVGFGMSFTKPYPGNHAVKAIFPGWINER